MSSLCYRTSRGCHPCGTCSHQQGSWYSWPPDPKEGRALLSRDSSLRKQRGPRVEESQSVTRERTRGFLAAPCPEAAPETESSVWGFVRTHSWEDQALWRVGAVRRGEDSQ